MTQGGSKERGVSGAGAMRGGGALDGRHDAGVVEAVGGRANRGVRRKGVQCSGLGGWVAGWPLWAGYRPAALGSTQ
jgi:hypothetical protein